MAFRAQRKAKETKAEQRRIEIEERGVVSRMTESAHLYIDSLESLCPDRQDRCVRHAKTYLDAPVDTLEVPSVSIIADAWWSMMLRAILWHLSVVLVELPGLPFLSNLYGETTQIWIT